MELRKTSMTDKNLKSDISENKKQHNNAVDSQQENPQQKAPPKKQENAGDIQVKSAPVIMGSVSPGTEPPSSGKKLWQRSWFWCLVVPFLFCCIYFGLIASDRYVAETKVIIKQTDNNNKIDFGFALLGAGGSSGRQDAQLVREFILSLDMLHELDKSLGLRKHYQSKDADFLSRMWDSDSQEDFLNYYRNHISIDFDENSGVLTIRAQAFTPEFAQKIVQAVVKRSEQYINQIGYELANEQVNFVKNELDRATENLRESKQKIINFQEKYQLFNPEQESGAKLSVVNGLEADITRQEAELTNLRSYMNESAGDVVALKAKISALQDQLAVERQKLVGDDSNNLSEVNAKHADLLLQLGFATDVYKGSLASLEQARIEAYRKIKYLVVVDSPSLAEEAEYPRKIYNIFSILFVLSLGYGALSIIWATIREHRDV